MNCELKSGEFSYNIKKLAKESFISFEEESEDELKAPTRGRKLNNYYVNSCGDSCKETACDSIGN